MGAYHVEPLERLIEQFERMPGIGHKSAQRLAYYILGLSKTETETFKNYYRSTRKNSLLYSLLQLDRQGALSGLRNAARDKSTICVVEDPRDVFALERTNEYHGTYHVLHGVISP